ncbi:hypothetical protein CC79DRAFT_1398914 [Sarocladium strictum]
MSRCRYCAELSIEALVELASHESFMTRSFPRRSYYQHHESFKDLEAAAIAGCDLCLLISDSFKGSFYPTDDNDFFWIPHWERLPPPSAMTMYDYIQDVEHTNVRLSINTQNGLQAYESERMDAAQALDTLLVHVGPLEKTFSLDTGSSLSGSEDSIPDLELLLTTSTGYLPNVRGHAIGRLKDSVEDWEAESQKMGSVYRNAAVTIYASMASGSAQGILHKTPKYPGPATTQLKVFTNPLDDTVTIVSKLDASAGENLFNLTSSSPLSKRAWCLQEEVLSPRRLYFGAHGLYWQCPRAFQASDGLPQGGINLFPDDLQYLNSALHSLAGPIALSGTAYLSLSRNTLLKEYYILVVSYSSRHLTVPSDKLPAMAGVAAGLASLLGRSEQSARYLAGLWDTDLLTGLMWVLDYGRVPCAPVYRAPSWSWASTDGELIFDLANYPYKSDASRWDLQIVDASITLKDPSNQFGEVISGSLDVYGFTIPLICCSQLVVNARTADHPLRIGDVYFDELPTDEKAVHRMQYLFRFGHHGKLCLAAVRAAYPHQHAVTDIGDMDLANIQVQPLSREYTILILRCIHDWYGTGVIVGQGLVLLKQDHSENYERMGCVRELEVSDDWMDTWDSKQLRIV